MSAVARWVAGLMLAAVAIIVVAKTCRLDAPITLPADPHEAQIGILRAQVAELSLRVQQRDTVWLRAKARVDTLRDSVLTRLTDTVYVREYVTRTDSALRACSALADDCRQFRLRADALIDSTRVQVGWWQDAYRGQAASARRWRRLTWIAGGAGLVVGAWVRGGI